ncbi:hypothetical protein BKA66DRAFT_555278 [Pyrenochaeta sp. MPI-SDFR-AT-0127]|nr:hypothetical protein BKA66DRAFT_555278 [Pyrenochaeta sp. MPI-SDFR-AT-0127]
MIMDHSKPSFATTSEPEKKRIPSTTEFSSSDMENLPDCAEVQISVESNEGSVNNLKPSQMLLQTTITVECGAKLNTKFTMHEEMLRCHSTSFDQLCAKAKPIRDQYTQCKITMDRIACCIFPEVTHEQFEAAHLEQKVAPLIVQTYEKYPLLEHHASVKKVIEMAVDDQIGQKSTKVAPSTRGNKKDSRDNNRDMSLKERLSLLQSRGVRIVAELLFAKLHKITKSENMKAASNPVKAAAQRRIILPEFEATTVQSFIRWIYQGSLTYQNADQLYALLNLSSNISVPSLSELCLQKLHYAAIDTIRLAIANGDRIQALLEFGSAHTDNALKVVFTNVLKDKDPPKRLLQLVIDTLADNLDMELWAHLRNLIGHELALQLIEVMIDRQQIKAEGSC